MRTAYVGERQIAARDLTIKLTADDEEILAVSGSAAQAKKSGATTLRAAATLGNTTVHGSCDVTVRSKLTIGALENCLVALDAQSRFLMDIQLDGEQLHVGDHRISLTVADSDIADGMIEKSEDGSRAYIVLSGKQEGQTSAKAALEVNGVAAELTVPFTVVPAKQLREIALRLDQESLAVAKPQRPALRHTAWTTSFWTRRKLPYTMRAQILRWLG